MRYLNMAVMTVLTMLSMVARCNSQETQAFRDAETKKPTSPQEKIEYYRQYHRDWLKSRDVGIQRMGGPSITGSGTQLFSSEAQLAQRYDARLVTEGKDLLLEQKMAGYPDSARLILRTINKMAGTPERLIWTSTKGLISSGSSIPWDYVANASEVKLDLLVQDGVLNEDQSRVAGAILTMLNTASDVKGYDKSLSAIISLAEDTKDLADIAVTDKSPATRQMSVSVHSGKVSQTVQLSFQALSNPPPEASQTSTQDTPTLHQAAGRGNLAEVKRYLSQGGDVNVKDRWGMTALHWAAIGGRRDVVELLLDKGADVDIKNKDATPLMVAAVSGHIEVVKILIYWGADVNVKNRAGTTLLRLIPIRHSDVAEVLKQHGAKE